MKLVIGFSTLNVGLNIKFKEFIQWHTRLNMYSQSCLHFPNSTDSCCNGTPPTPSPTPPHSSNSVPHHLFSF